MTNDINDPRYGQLLTAEDRRKLDAFPDLLAELRNALRMIGHLCERLEDHGEDTGDVLILIHDIQDAIAKAEGRP